jgi:hypothetical protein
MCDVRRLLIALLAGLLVVLAAPPTGAARDREWGSTGAPDRTLKRGCATYHYHYQLTPPPGVDWMFETFLLDPDKKRVASGFFLSSADPVQDQSGFAFCKLNTRAGKFTIKGKVTISDPDLKVRWIPASTFRLRPPR